MATIDKKDLLEVLGRLRDVRAWNVRRDGDPWAFRQALIIVLELDTAAAHQRGVAPRDLSRFDDQARASAHRYMRGFQTKIEER